MEETNFFDKVYEVAKQIPYGRVTSYGAIAKYLGAARSARMVGWAMNNSLAKDVPAHRVVNRVGVLTGKHHFDGTNVMQQLLENALLRGTEGRAVATELRALLLRYDVVARGMRCTQRAREVNS